MDLMVKICSHSQSGLYNQFDRKWKEQHRADWCWSFTISISKCQLWWQVVSLLRSSGSWFLSPCSDTIDGNGGVFSPASFGIGNGFDLSGEQFNTRPEDIRSEYCSFSSSVNSIGRFSNGGEERISGVERLTNGDGEEELKRQSINKVEFTEI